VAPPAAPHFVACAVTGEHVHELDDLAELVAWVAELVDPGGGDVVIADGAGRAVAVVLDNGSVVKVR
jgi:hypothetical protein